MTSVTRALRLHVGGTLGVAVLLAAGCPATQTVSPSRDGPRAEGSVTTDRPAYQLSDGITNISLLIRNTSASTLYLPHCGMDPMVLLERLEGREWIRVLPKVCPATQIVPPVRILPGTTLTIPVVFRVGPNITSAELTGTFRIGLRPLVGTDSREVLMGEPTYAELMTSPNFTIRP